MFRHLHSIGIALVCLAGSVFSQMPLHYIYSRAVREGYTLQTKVDSLSIDTRVNSGLAISRYAMVIVPGEYKNNRDKSIEEVDPRSLDSIEITLSFQLPSDFVADSMWLWIDGEPVPAQIQDRALASQQYRQIVGVRRDPALLETWGRGSYNLRIFPTSSLKSRKIMIEFHHTFDDDSTAGATTLMTACIPVTYDSLYSRHYYGFQSFDKTIGTVTAAFSADDRTEYTVDLPGVGNGTFSNGKPLTLSAEKVCKLGVGMITAEDPSSTKELLWVGHDPVAKSTVAGLAATLSDETMRFENEPDTRIVIIDMHSEKWDWNEYYKKRAEQLGYTYTSYSGYETVDIMARAKKSAVLALQQYLKPGQKFNVLIGGESVLSVFDAPVEVSDANLEKAMLAVVAATPSAASSTGALVESAIAQSPKGIAILVTDLFQPFNYQQRVDNKYEITASGAAYNDMMTALAATLKKSSLTLFTVDDNYELYRIALESGGYRLSGILNRYNIAFHYEIIDGRRVSIPDLPPLFGSRNSSGIRNLTVTADGLDDMVYTVDGYYNGVIYYSRTVMGGDVMEEMAVDAASTPVTLGKLVLPTTYYTTGDVFVRVAGKIAVEKTDCPVKVKIRGKNGGLWFTYDIDAAGFYPPATSMYRPYESAQWAFRSAEQLAFDNSVDNAGTIEKIGREYHIVTRQTSLLALEPDMELWVDSTWQQEEQNNVARSGSAEGAVLADASAEYAAEGGAPASTSASGSGVDLDGISLDDILRKQGMAVIADVKALQRKFSLTAHGAMVRITLPFDRPADPVLIRLFDLKGRIVAVRKLMPDEITRASFEWNMAGIRGGLSRGMYTVQVTSGALDKIVRITLTGK